MLGLNGILKMDPHVKIRNEGNSTSTVEMKLVRAARILPEHAEWVPLRMTEANSERKPILFEHNEKHGNELGIEIEDSLLPGGEEAQILIRNGSSKPVNLVEDAVIGDAGPLEVIDPTENPESASVAETETQRSHQRQLSEAEKDAFRQFVGRFHDIFVVDDTDLGRTAYAEHT